MIMIFAIFYNILAAFGWLWHYADMVIFWVIVGGCEEVLGDWGWLWVVVTILWVVGDDWGWL